MTVALFKIYAALLIWLLAVIGGLLPLYLNKEARLRNSLLNMMAAGIFLSGSCIHLLNDAAMNTKLSHLGCSIMKRQTTEGQECFPIAYAIYSIGFLIVFFVEIFAHYLERKFLPGASHEKTPLIVNTRTRKSEKIRYMNSSSNTDIGHEHSHSELDAYEHIQEPKSTHQYGQISTTEQSRKPIECEDMEVTHAHVHGLLHEDTSVLSFVIFLSLSFHSIMEGVGVGASYRKPYDVFLAIIAHKSVAAFSLSMELRRHMIPLERVIKIIMLFSLMTPIGILLGSLITAAEGMAIQESISSGICIALAGGTFLYVAVMEIIPQEMQNRKNLLAKSIALIFGFTFFSILALWI